MSNQDAIAATQPII